MTWIALVAAIASGRRVSFWYGPASYGGTDINRTLEVLSTNRGAATNVFVYCGHSVGRNGLEYDPKQGALCLEPYGSNPSALMTSLASLGIIPEIVVNSGSSNITDYREFFRNATANAVALVQEGKRFGAKGISFDLEPQVGVPASTKADSLLFAAFLGKAKAAFAAAGMRTTVAVAEWCPMLKNYGILARATDRLLDMETYSADSMNGWINGDAYGGYYRKFVTEAGPSSAAPGMIPWNESKCGGHMCWSNSPEAAVERMDRIAIDGIEEVALFRLSYPNGEQGMPLPYWWPLLKKFLSGGS